MPPEFASGGTQYQMLFINGVPISKSAPIKQVLAKLDEDRQYNPSITNIWEGRIVGGTIPPPEPEAEEYKPKTKATKINPDPDAEKITVNISSNVKRYARKFPSLIMSASQYKEGFVPEQYFAPYTENFDGYYNTKTGVLTYRIPYYLWNNETQSVYKVPGRYDFQIDAQGNVRVRLWDSGIVAKDWGEWSQVDKLASSQLERYSLDKARELQLLQLEQNPPSDPFIAPEVNTEVASNGNQYLYYGEDTPEYKEKVAACPPSG